MNKKSIFISIILCIILLLLAIDPKSSIEGCFKGICVWATSIFPALFPFFFITTVLAQTGLIEKIGSLLSPLTRKLYNCDGIAGYVYAMSIISGYPVGAKITADLYENKVISRGQALRITTFTSTSGPLFIVGTVGVGMFVDKTIGLLILVSHILGASLNGLLYRNCYKDEIFTQNHFQRSTKSLEDCMLNSIKSIAIVGGYIALFFMIITMLNNCNIFSPFISFLDIITPLDANTLNAIINGLIEVTRGCLDLSKPGLSKNILLIISTALISFGGFSIHMQGLTFLKKFNIPTSFYLLSKTTQTALSCIIATVFSLFV